MDAEGHKQEAQRPGVMKASNHRARSGRMTGCIWSRVSRVPPDSLTPLRTGRSAVLKGHATLGRYQPEPEVTTALAGACSGTHKVKSRVAL